jgi:dipeptidyl aminopeptidase/acylaminoacyl peptidase
LRKAAALLALSSFAASGFSQNRRFSADDLTKIVRIGDQQISPDGKTISIVVGRANLKEDRWDSEIDFVDIATKQLRVMTRDRIGAGSVRWSPSGDRIAYLAQDGEKKVQIYVMPVNGGESVQLTHSKTPVTVMAWRPDGQGLAYAAADEEPERKDEAKFEDAFEVGNNSYLERAAARPVHLWTVTTSGEAKRLTSGSWSLPVHMAPSGPPSQIAYTTDGSSIVFVRAESPITGDSDTARLQIMDASTGAMRPLTKSAVAEGNPILSPDGTQVAYGSSRGEKRGNEETVYVAPVAGGAGRDVASALDRGISGAAWMPDGKALLLSANDGTRVTYWMQPLDGTAKRLAMGSLCPSPTMNVGKDGAVALTATDATHPAELFYMAHVGDAPVQLTHLQTVTDGITLGRQ